MLKLDLQFFGEEDDLDFETMLNEFEQEWTEDETTPEQQEESVESDEESQEEVPVDEAKEDVPSQVNDEDAQKRNAAFAELRRQAQEAKKYQEFVQKLADQNGLKPEDVLARFEEQRLEQEAEKQNVPVEVLKRIQSLESENFYAKEQVFAERFNAQVENTIAKFGANEQDVQATFQYAAENGIDFRNNPITFEAVYRMAHLDTIVQKEVEKARQTDLENKRKRQESATVPNGNSVSQVSDDLSDSDVDAMLEKMGIRI